MTLVLSIADYHKLSQAELIVQNGSFDKFDITRRFPTLFGEGYCRFIELRDGISLDICDFQLHKSRVTEIPDLEHPLDFRFFALRDCQSQKIKIGTGEYVLSGSGMSSEGISVDRESLRTVVVGIQIIPEVFCSFARDTSGELPPELQHLVRRSEQKLYERSGTQTPAMQVAVQQILQCPYQGLTKQMYLESKIWELAALVVDQEIQINQGGLEMSTLRPSEVDCIYHAKEILLKHLDNPPSLMALARRVGLNDRKLKQGFRIVFGTTVFGLLHDYRMELAHKLLVEGNMSVTQVAQTVGYASLGSFSSAFRKKFGTSPKSCHR